MPNRPLLSRVLCALCLLCASLTPGAAPAPPEPTASAAPAAPAPWPMLAVYSFHPDLPWTQAFRRGLHAGLAGQGAQLFEEFLDMARLDQQDPDDVVRHVALRYAGVPLQAVVAESLPAFAMLAQHPALLHPAPRFLILAGDGGSVTEVRHAGRQTEVRIGGDYLASIQSMLQLVQPRQVLVIADTTQADGQARLEAWLAAYRLSHTTAALEVMAQRPMAELLQRVAALPPGSAVYYLPIFRDGAGQRFTPYEAARLISQAAAAPVFSFFDTLVGSGIVGGYVLSAERMGRLAAAQVLAERAHRPLPIGPGDGFVSLYDWRTLQRWGIDEDRLPPGAEVRERRPGLWQQYRGPLLVGFAVVLALATYAAVLQWLVRRRTRDLALAARRAEAASQAKTAFLANMSHEIRTPLNAIIGLAHGLHGMPQGQEQDLRLSRIEGAGRHLLSVLDDVLVLSRIETGQLTLHDELFQPTEVLQQVALLITDAARSRGLQLRTRLDGDPGLLRGDPARLQQALLNLASNAVKFTERGEVVLSARVLADDGHRATLRFECQDTGIGIPAADRARLFQAFEQLEDGPSRRHGGTGLGLALTHRLVTLMHGELGVEAPAAGGSLFWFSVTLPHGVAPPLPPPAPPAVEQLRARHAGRRILMAEDNPVNALVAGELLEAAGLVVLPAENGQEALAQLARGPVDLVLMDVQMPEMDGLQATRALRAQPAHALLPVVALTANAFEEDRQACLASGMDEVLTKPVQPETLYAMLLRRLDEAARSRGGTGG